MNSCHFSGRLTADAELMYAKSGTSILKFTIANECGFGKFQRTEFIKCFKFNAEKLAQYLTKGKAIICSNCEFKLQTWEDQDGQKRSKPEFMVGQIEFQKGDPKNQSDSSQSMSSNEMNNHSDVPF